ncbi:hypothetical protein [Leptospira perolatii]|nr:hypothetical protein [Leptospira perolatii]
MTCYLEDGSLVSYPLPRQGILPHDLIYLLVETLLGWEDGFFGSLARKEDMIYQIGQKGGVVSEQNIHTLQIEALVESFKAELWMGGHESPYFAESLVMACNARGVPTPMIAKSELEKMRLKFAETGILWDRLSASEYIDFEYSPYVSIPD